MKDILVLGSSGLLGSELTSGKYLSKYKIISHSLNSETDLNLNLENYESVIKMIEKVQPDTIINLVSLTNVDYCEEHPKSSYEINIATVKNIISGILKMSPKPFLVHISTDQVYDGVRLNTEDDVSLSNYYSYSKYCGELIAKKVDSTILRTNFFGKSKITYRKSITDWLYTELSTGNEINVFEDVWFNPLSMYNLCKIIELVVEKKINGTFNLGSNKFLNKADFAFHFANNLNLSIENIKRCKVSDVKFLKAYRPRNMTMDSSKFENKFNIKLPELIDEIKLVSKDYLK